MSDTCADCQHAKPVLPIGPWRQMGFDHASHRHCALDKVPHAHVIRAERGCCWTPSKWAPMADEAAA